MLNKSGREQIKFRVINVIVPQSLLSALFRIFECITGEDVDIALLKLTLVLIYICRN